MTFNYRFGKLHTTNAALPVFKQYRYRTYLLINQNKSYEPENNRAGFGRTGTLSTYTALKELGYPAITCSRLL